MALDPRLEQLRAMLSTEVDRAASPEDRRQKVRAGRELTAGLLTSITPPVAEERDVIVPTGTGDVRVRVYRPREGTLPALIYIHGGGWWMGDLEDVEPLCRRRATAADCAVLSIEYRLAPEHPFPAGLDDCWAASRWIVENAADLGIDPDRIVIGGGSAGGNLAAAVTLLARDTGGPRFVAQFLEVPACDLTLPDRRSMQEYGVGYGLSREDIEECVRFYVGPDGDPSRPLVSPFFADLHDLPPALILTSECDPVRDDGEAYAAKLQAAGVAVMLKRFDGLGHGCGEMDVLLSDIAGEYAATIATYLQEAFATAKV